MQNAFVSKKIGQQKWTVDNTSFTLKYLIREQDGINEQDRINVQGGFSLLDNIVKLIERQHNLSGNASVSHSKRSAVKPVCSSLFITIQRASLYLCI